MVRWSLWVWLAVAPFGAQHLGRERVELLSSTRHSFHILPVSFSVLPFYYSLFLLFRRGPTLGSLKELNRVSLGPVATAAYPPTVVPVLVVPATVAVAAPGPVNFVPARLIPRAISELADEPPVHRCVRPPCPNTARDCGARVAFVLPVDIVQIASSRIATYHT